MPTLTLTTEAADISVRDSGGAGPAVLLVHGNSSCKAVFDRQFDSALADQLRLIAFDLPGHGQSSNARDPARDYTLGGYARTALEVLRQLGVDRATVFGWSLGGHVALDMISRFPGMTGVMISGTPPVPGGLEGMSLGFQPSEHMGLTGAPVWSAAEAEAYARATAGGPGAFAPYMLEAALRTDGVARETFVADALSGRADDQRRIVESARTPLAIVNGAEDPFLNAAYFGTVAYANLWDGKVHSLAGVGHAPFREAPDRFNPLLSRFVAETAGR